MKNQIITMLVVIVAVVGKSHAQVPLISGFSPAVGTNGALVTLTGANFSPVAASNLVFLGAARATVTGASSTGLTVVVPPGASFSPPRVTVGKLTAQAGKFFLPTFAGSRELNATSFAPPVNLPFGSPRNSLVVSDVDGDGRPDLLGAGIGSSQSILGYRNIGTGGTITTNTFAAPAGPLSPSLSTSAEVGDVDGDGRPDIIEVPRSPGTSLFIRQNLTAPGNFSSSAFGPRIGFAGLSPFKPTLADLNRDGYPELIVANARHGSVSVYPHLGTPGPITSNTFGARIELPTGGVNRDVVACDLDGDGWIDLATASSGPVGSVSDSGAVYILRNMGLAGQVVTTSFAPFVTLGAPDINGFFIVAGDLDGDGRTDLVVNNRSASIGLFRNLSVPGDLSTNSFSPKTSIPTAAPPGQSSIADLDGDGLPDLVVANAPALSLLKNLGGGMFSLKVDLPVDAAVIGAATGDLNGDGRPDAALFGQSSGVIVIENIVPAAQPPTITALESASLKTNEGATATFVVTATGTLPLHYQWNFGGSDLAGETNAVLTLTNITTAQAGIYTVTVANFAGQASSNALLEVNRVPVADASATDSLIISINGSNAVAVLDGSRSSDPDGDLLSYAWFVSGIDNPFATGVVAVTTLPLGTNYLALQVNDGLATSSQAFTLEIITTSQAVDRLVELVADSAANPQPLLATLRAALASIDRSQPATAINQLEAFINKVQAQVAPLDSALADQLVAEAQATIDALNGGPSPAPAAIMITAVGQSSNGKPHLKIRGWAGRVHIVEVSPDMVTWTKVGVAVCCGGCDYEFEDGQGAAAEACFYRVLSPK